MLRVFENNTLLQVAIILVAVVLLWLPAIANPVPMAPAESYAPLYNVIFSLRLSSIAAVLIAMALVLLGGFWLNLVLANTSLVSQNSLLPTLLYILFMSAGATTLSPSLIVCVLIIASVRLLMLQSSHLSVTSDKIFGAAAIMGLCSLFYLPSLALILSYILIAVNYRLYSWRDWIVLSLGLIAPYIPVWAVLFFNDNLGESFEQMAYFFSTFHAPTVPTSTPLPTIANGILLLLFVVSLFILWNRLSESTVVWKKNATTVMLFSVATIAMLPYSGFFPVNLQFLAIPGALCLNHWLTLGGRRRPSSRRKWSTRLYDLLLIVIIIAALLC